MPSVAWTVTELNSSFELDWLENQVLIQLNEYSFDLKYKLLEGMWAWTP